jgi:hypothetical protein
MGSFFNNFGTRVLGAVGAGNGVAGRGSQFNHVNGGPYAGVAPTLAGANAGYGGAVQPGASPMAGATPLNPYAAAARQATGT